MDERTDGFEPKIVAFLCRWCSYAGADLAGVSRMTYPPNVIPIRVNCSGRVDAEMVLAALEKGADGVLIGGCHPGDCHYVSGNYKTRRRVTLLKRALSEIGIDPRRVHLEWISANEGAKFQRTVTSFIDEIKGLGPSPVAEVVDGQA
ncbi:methyl-viologen-reducing hydrogenase subunit delta [Candidatus Acetothermia bacterium]|nr:MAG: methyl-viologen-reducing hydrogenase subunit delta [Candidatus Acetothermia bacterium]